MSTNHALLLMAEAELLGAVVKMKKAMHLTTVTYPIVTAKIDEVMEHTEKLIKEMEEARARAKDGK